jgi:hypothetical protein
MSSPACCALRATPACLDERVKALIAERAGKGGNNLAVAYAYGSARVALASGAPIVPIGLIDTDAVLAPGESLPTGSAP